MFCCSDSSQIPQLQCLSYCTKTNNEKQLNVNGISSPVPSLPAVNKHKPWIETSYHGVITENMDTVLLDPPLVALDKDAPVPYAGRKNKCTLTHGSTQTQDHTEMNLLYITSLLTGNNDSLSPNLAETKQSSLSTKTNLWFYSALSMLVAALTKRVLTDSCNVCTKVQSYRKAAPIFSGAECVCQ